LNRGRFGLPGGASTRASFAGVDGGPVKVESTNTVPLLSAERLIYRVNNVPTSFSEMLALPDGQLDTIYWLPWYDNRTLSTQLRIANASGTDATVDIIIGGTPVSGSPFTIPAGTSLRKSFTGIDSGPVQIVSDADDVRIVAAERVIYTVNGVDASLTEMMALPASQVDTIHWLPWYNNVTLDTQLRIANPSDTLPASVDITIGGAPMPGSPFTVAPGASLRTSFPGIDSGPVKIESTVDILASERVIYRVNNVPTSFSEMLSLPNKLLDTIYWLPRYNNVTLNTQLRIANPSDSQQASVDISIDGTPVPGSPFTVPVGGSIRKTFPNIDRGPVKIESNIPIVAAERVIYQANGVGTSFSEMMALPNSLLDTICWLPWYNNKTLDTQLRFGVP
jgi:hypothetical protein